jgi:hypothetical protein
MKILKIRLIAPLLCGLMMLAVTTSGFAERNEAFDITVTRTSDGTIIATTHNNDLNFGGEITVKLPGPGTYIFRYSSGPKKGQVLKTVRATKAGPVTVSVPKSSAAK